MKARSSLALIPARFIFVSTLLFVTCLSEVVDAQSWQKASSDLFTNISIVWRTDTSQLANSVWIYRRLLPHIFPTAVVSNAVVLGSLQSRGFPQSSTNNVFISEQMPPQRGQTILLPNYAATSFDFLHW